MSVRRLDPIQPTSPFAFNAENLSWAKKTISTYPVGKQASAVIALLWRAQEQNNHWTSKPAIEYVADMLGMSFIRVYEVATFYTMFQLSPVGKRAHIQVCGTTPCMLRGAEDLKKVCQSKIHHEPHHISADGNLSWEEVECLGACVNAPMVQVWKDTYEDLTPETLSTLIDDLNAGRKPKAGPQINRQQSMPVGGATALTDKSLYSKQQTFKRVEAPPAAAIAAVAPVAIVKPAAEVTAVKVTTPGAPQPLVFKDEKPKPMRLVVTRSAAKPVAAAAPELLKKPRGKADDLKLIWGVGPALEKLLNKIGVWHFDQIADWSAKDLTFIDEKLEGFKGRAKRDEWIRQSKKLAKGWRPDSAVGEKPKGRG
jgi:NADH-quinone oxidoreductase subunit E